MKKKILAMIVSMICAGPVAKADPVKTRNLTPEQKRQIAQAIEVLAEAGVLSQDQNKCTTFDSDIIRELYNEGLIQNGDSIMHIVCVGASPQ
jgi:hypothetical protein